MTPRVRRYCREAAEQFGVSVDAVMHSQERKKACKARQLVMLRLRDDGFTFPQIGKWKGRHHTTVMHAVFNRTVDKFLSVAPVGGE